MIPKPYIDFYGDQTRWFIGRVVSITDPLYLGRIKVRIFGVHSENTIDIPDSDLPWAQVVAPITEGGTDGLGNNLGVQVGSNVFGIFLDGTHSQLPLVVGSMPKEGDVNPLIRGESSLDKTVTVTGAPSDPYAAEYPHNKVTQTTSGHVIEIDDTPEGERIHIRHKSGSFIEFHPDGSLVIKTTNTYIDAGTNANIKATNVNVEATDVTVTSTTSTVTSDTVNVTGTSGDVVVDGVSLVNHTHQHIDGPGLAATVGTTQKPNKV
jgi:phage baseplate assembly protein gpV